MKLKLDIKNRLLMSAIYPPTGDMITMAIVKNLMTKINLTTEEITDICLVKVEDGYKWDDTKDKDKDIEIGKIELEVLKKRINELDNQKLITVELIDLCKMINDLKPKS